MPLFLGDLLGGLTQPQSWRGGRVEEGDIGSIWWPLCAPIVSAGIDSLLMFARMHEPGRAERLLEETAAAAASTADTSGCGTSA